MHIAQFLSVEKNVCNTQKSLCVLTCVCVCVCLGSVCINVLIDFVFSVIRFIYIVTVYHN